MKVVLYIGHHKVGSTALQDFLARNWKGLAQAGILYPNVEAHGAAGNMFQLLKGDLPDAALPVHIREPHSALAYRMIADVSKRPIPKQFQGLPATRQMLRAIRTQVDLLEPNTVILCSEAFANFGQVNPELVDRLIKPFEGAEFQIYCALRRPDEYVTSWHGQRLKVGEKATPLSAGGLKDYFGGIHFDYRQVVEAWIDRVPNAKISIRNYADVLGAGGSAEDFMDQTGLAMPDPMIPARRANESLPLAAYPIMEKAVHKLEQPAIFKLSRYLQNHGAKLTDVNNRDVEVLGAEQRQKLWDEFVPVSDYLRKYAASGTEFFPDIDKVKEARPVPADEAASALVKAIDVSKLQNEQAADFVRDLAGR